MLKLGEKKLQELILAHTVTPITRGTIDSRSL